MADAKAHTRVIYFMQTGYNDALIKEDVATRLQLIPSYVHIFTRQMASAEE
jgi:hypothetical protein